MCSNCVPCPLCSQSTFSSIDSLRISLIKAANGPLTCPICRDVLLGLDKLTIHLFSHTSLIADSVSRMNPQLLNHEKSEKIQVKSCTNDVNAHVSFPDGSAPTLVSVSEVFTDQPRCDICGLTFATSDLLHMHNRLVHQNYGNATPIAGDANYQCHLCAKVFKMKGSLRVHLKVVHLLGLPSSKNVPKLTICEKIRKKNETGDVSQGQQTPTTTISLGIQNLIDRQLTAKENELKGSAEVKARNEIPKGTESAKIWECDICAKSFTTKYFLKKHKRLHTGEMPYTCELCGKTFTFQQSYHKHLLYHSDEKPHACQTCGRAFKELSTLHNHERIHSGEKPFKCETCAKCFRQRVSYLVHKRIHTGVMPYKCQVCQKSFRYKVSQRTHKCVAQASEPTTPTTTTQSEDLLQKLLQSTSILPEETHVSVPMADSGTHLKPESSEAPSLKAELSEDLLNKSIDDIVAESCNKMGIGTNCDISDLFKVENSQPRIPSPSESFQNLCLYSPSSERITSHLETINEDSLRQLLYGVEDNL